MLATLTSQYTEAQPLRVVSVNCAQHLSGPKQKKNNKEVTCYYKSKYLTICNEVWKFIYAHFICRLLHPGSLCARF